MATRCKYGKLKSPSGRRRCKKRPSGASRTRRKSTSGGRCKFGKLKNPTGRRRCKKRPSGASAGRSRRKPAGMARKGSKCSRFKRVRVSGGGMQRRCASYRR